MNQALFESWLRLQSRIIPGNSVALAMLEWPGHQPLFASVPENHGKSVDLERMLRLAHRGGRTVAADATVHAGEDGPGLRLAHPLVHSGKAIGAIVVETANGDLAKQKNMIQLLKWGNAYLLLLMNKRDAVRALGENALEILLPVMHTRRFQEAALAVVGVMAHHYGAERASLGICEKGRIKPIALSGSANFSPDSTLARQLGQVMDEALARGCSVRWPADDETCLPCHQELADKQADGGILSVVLRGINGEIGVVTLEKRKSHYFDAHEQVSADSVAQFLGLHLELKKSQEQSLITRAQSAFGSLFHRFTARHRIAWMAGVLAGFALLAVFLLSDATYRVGGPAELQGAIQRALIAPFDGYVAATYARAGERVENGFVLAELDDRELLLELRQLEGDLDELDRQFSKALAALDNAEARILKAQRAQVEVRIDLLQQRLTRTRLVAPFTSVIVAGDLSRSLGKPVERGEVLFELAPLNAYRVVLEVPDKDIKEIAEGQEGTLTLAASPTEQIPLEVVNITSLSDGDNQPGSFRVEARLIDAPATLRPGMRGVAKVEVGERRRIWIWTHELFDWIRYQLWAWLP